MTTLATFAAGRMVVDWHCVNDVTWNLLKLALSWLLFSAGWRIRGR